MKVTLYVFVLFSQRRLVTGILWWRIIFQPETPTK